MPRDGMDVPNLLCLHKEKTGITPEEVIPVSKEITLLYGK